MYKKNFKDAKNELILIEVDSNYFIRAYSEDGREIGTFDYHYMEGFENIPDIYELWGMNVVSKYQRRGIATEMLKIGEEVFTNVIYPSYYQTNIEGNHLSNEGFQFLKKCGKGDSAQELDLDDYDVE